MPSTPAEPERPPAGAEPAVRAHHAGITPQERLVRLGVLLVLLYAFLVGVELLGDGIAGLGGDVTDKLFEGVANPLAALSVGVLATVLVQSSSVTTSTIVALVASGVVDMRTAVPMVMGANIGTSVTSTLAAIGSIRRTEEFRRAFAGATMHDFFNLLSVLVLLPLELATGFLADTAVWLSDLVGDASGGEFRSPIKEFIGLGTDAVGGAIEAVAPGGAAAIATIVVGLTLLFATLVSITKTMKVVVAGPAERALDTALARSGLLAIGIGIVLTVAVQSSSISTSLLVPLIGAGVIQLERAYPLTIGANLGTTVTALLAALAVPQIEGLQIALVHLLFNVSGTALLYPVPALRQLPLRCARALADLAVRRRAAVAVYLVTAFVVLPLLGALVLR